MKTIKVKNIYDIPKNYTGIVEYSNGSKQWWLNDKWFNEYKIDQFTKEFGYPEKTAIKLTYWLKMNKS